MNEWRFARKEFQAESSIHNSCRGFAVRGNRGWVFRLMDKIEMKDKEKILNNYKTITYNIEILSSFCVFS
jgi:hypothetical protein